MSAKKRTLPGKGSLSFIVGIKGINVVNTTLIKGKEALESPRDSKIAI